MISIGRSLLLALICGCEPEQAPLSPEPDLEAAQHPDAAPEPPPGAGGDAAEFSPYVRILVAQVAVPEIAKRIESELLHFAQSRDAARLAEATQLAEQLRQESPGYPYGHFLAAFACQLEGDVEGERAAKLQEGNKMATADAGSGA